MVHWTFAEIERERVKPLLHNNSVDCAIRFQAFTIRLDTPQFCLFTLLFSSNLHTFFPSWCFYTFFLFILPSDPPCPHFTSISQAPIWASRIFIYSKQFCGISDTELMALKFQFILYFRHFCAFAVLQHNFTDEDGKIADFYGSFRIIIIFLYHFPTRLFFCVSFEP